MAYYIQAGAFERYTVGTSFNSIRFGVLFCGAYIALEAKMLKKKRKKRENYKRSPKLAYTTNATYLYF